MPKRYATTKHGQVYHGTSDNVRTICRHAVYETVDARMRSTLSAVKETVAQAVRRGLYCGNCFRDPLNKLLA